MKGIEGLPTTQSVGATQPKRIPGEELFDRVAAGVDQAIALQQQAEGNTQAFTVGESGDMHGALLAVEKADISLKYMVSIRNRALEAYRELMRIG